MPPGNPGLRHGRHFGQDFHAVGAGHAQGFDHARAHVRRGSGGIEECHLDLPAHKVLHDRPGAAIVDRLKARLRLLSHQLIEQVGRTADAGAARRGLVRVGPEPAHQLLVAVDRHFLVDRQQHRRIRHEGDRREVLHHVVVELQELGNRDMRVPDTQKQSCSRPAPRAPRAPSRWRRLRRPRSRSRPSAPAAPASLRPQRPPHGIGHTTGRIGHDQVTGRVGYFCAHAPVTATSAKTTIAISLFIVPPRSV